MGKKNPRSNERGPLSYNLNYKLLINNQGFESG